MAPPIHFQSLEVGKSYRFHLRGPSVWGVLEGELAEMAHESAPAGTTYKVFVRSSVLTGIIPIRRSSVASVEEVAYIKLPRAACQMADHIEMDHERELVPGIGPRELAEIHRNMHAQSDGDRDHTHRRSARAGKEAC